MISTKMLERIGAGLLAPAFAALLLAGCEVKNPGAILDSDLDDIRTLGSLVTGMSADFSTALDDNVFNMVRGSDEVTGSGSYFNTGLLRTGVVNREDNNFPWGSLHRARWVAEDGIRRMLELDTLGLYNGSPLVARAFLLAGLAHRVSGENLCYTVIDGSAVMPKSAHFDSTLLRADSSIYHATLAGIDTMVTAAHGLKAQAYAGLGQWSNATTESALVPTDFTYVAFFSNNSGREENVLQDESWGRAEYSVYGSRAGANDPTQDPRAPYIKCQDEPAIPIPVECNSQLGADGTTFHWQQNKYPTVGTNIRVISGEEMRLIEAEAFLEGGDLGNFKARIDEVRGEYGLGPITLPATANDAWLVLDDERMYTLWLEGRRWWDAFRWDHATPSRRFMPAVGWLYGDLDAGLIYDKDPAISKRGYCFPISFDECQTNLNVRDAPECAGQYVAP
jgi:hypothetical protein